MNKEKFIEMLNDAKEDENGRFYVLGKYNNKIYFGTITTICEDIFNMTSDEKTEEIYDRHFWNDDTLECHVVSNKHNKEIEYKVPKRIEKLHSYSYEEQISGFEANVYQWSKSEEVLKNKINELIESFNRYECLIEKSNSNE